MYVSAVDGNLVINMPVLPRWVPCEVSRPEALDGSRQVNWVSEETLQWISSPVFRPIYSPSGLIALLGLIIPRWILNIRPLFFCLSLLVPSLFLAYTFNLFSYQHLLYSWPLNTPLFFFFGCFLLPFFTYSHSKRGRERLTGHFRDQRHEVIQAGL